jgi:3-phenylpropionate/trans-cinnamate dioxygenase ferredoxin component
MKKILIGNKTDFPLGKLTQVTVDNMTVCLAHTEDGFYAIADECPHESTSLSEGDLEGMTVVCPMHGSCFDIRTGSVRSLPAQEGVAAFQSLVEGNEVYLLL